MKYYTVGQINTYIKNLIGNDYLLKNLTIKGEVSNCKYHSMGHIYFSVKDETGSMPCVMFKGNIPTGLKFRLEDGQSVYMQGGISVYERDGRYQFLWISPERFQNATFRSTVAEINRKMNFAFAVIDERT